MLWGCFFFTLSALLFHQSLKEHLYLVWLMNSLPSLRYWKANSVIWERKYFSRNLRNILIKILFQEMCLARISDLASCYSPKQFFRSCYCKYSIAGLDLHVGFPWQSPIPCFHLKNAPKIEVMNKWMWLCWYLERTRDLLMVLCGVKISKYLLFGYRLQKGWHTSKEKIISIEIWEQRMFWFRIYWCAKLLILG